VAGPVSVRMDEDLLARLDEEAGADQRTRAQVIRLALSQYLEQQQRQRRREEAIAS
jgi:predicted transcriptional regulator